MSSDRSHVLDATPRWLLAACLAALAAGCPGQPADDPPGGPPDARTTPKDAPLGDARPPDAPAEFMCRDRITVGLDSGHHNPGQNCQQSCHNHGFYMSGTLYSSPNGGQTVAGASITFVDADGNTGDIQTNQNGNFWWSLPVKFPVKIIASMCPNVQPMVATVNEAGAGCNQAGCHSGGGGPGRIHLP